MAIGKGEERGPTWGDVSTLLAHLEKEHNCQMRFTIGRKLVGKEGLVIDIEALRAKGRNDWYVCTHVIRYWPTHQARTMPGLLVQGLWALSEQVTEYDEMPLFRMPEAELPLPPGEA